MRTIAHACSRPVLLQYHPLIEEFVDEYLAVVNAEADAHNARVREMLDAALAARGK